VSQDAVADPLVRPEELVETHRRVTVLDVRWQLGGRDGRAAYLEGHVPGACFVDLEADLADPVGDGSRGRHPLPDPERFAAAMRRCGVRRDRPVVVYDDVAGASAARAWWLLRHHGHPGVRVLDGGWSAYVAAGGPVQSGPVTTEPGDFSADPGHLPLLDAEGAARVARDGVLIDARAAERFRGETEPVDPVAGHVPGAVNLPFQGNLDRGRFRSTDEIRARYAGLGSPVGVYCGSGVTAAHNVLALHRIGVDAALYAGSWSEWVANPDRPVAPGE
jgi:thiosulfate/3-mercaptopyruvate sulfurtransferase